MIAHIGVVAVFTALGLYVFLLCRWWYKRLTLLATRFDVAERRRRASHEFLAMLAFLVVPVLAVLVGCMVTVRASVSGAFVVAALLGCLAPAVIYWVRKIRCLYALGYGRQQPY
jgi:hypothetical protein